MKRYLILALLIFTGSVLLGQNGSIKGKVIDKKTKQPLVGANVMVMETFIGAATDENGVYFIENVPENIYKLKVDYIGYITYIESDVRVIRGKTYYVSEIEMAAAIIQGEEVTVSTSLFSEEKRTPISAYSYAREEIKRAPGAVGDIFRAIESLPGVSSSGGEFSAFSVRGGAPKDNIILIDNIPFSSISHFVEGGGNNEVEGGRFSILASGLVDKAKFQAGGFSSQYGGRYASMLDLQIKEGNRESFSADATYDLFGWEVNYDGPSYLLDNTSLRISARQQDYKTLFSMIGNEGDGHPKFSDYIFKSSTEINKNNKLTLLGIYSKESMERTLWHYYKGEEWEETELQNQSEDKYLIGATLRSLTSANSFLKTSVYLSQIDEKLKEGEIYPTIVNGKIVENQDEVGYKFPIREISRVTDQIGIKQEFTQNFVNDLELNIGYNIQQLKMNLFENSFANDTIYVFDSEDIDENPEQKFLISTPDDVDTKFDNKRMEYAGYAELSFSPLNNFFLNIGGRYEYDDQSKDHNISPRISGLYKLTAISSINFAGGLYYQLPEIYRIAKDARNMNLKNEKSVQAILGYSHLLTDDVKLTVEGYYKKLENLLVSPEKTNNQLLNSGSGYSYGVDVAVIKKFVGSYYGQVNYSYNKCEVKDADNLNYYTYHFNQPHIFNILFGYQINDEWSLSTKWKYATGRPTDEYIIHKDVHNDLNNLRYSQENVKKNSTRFADYHSLNFRVDYRKQFYKNLALIVYVDIMNLYNRENQTTSSFVPRTGKVKYNGLEILPTLGFKLEI